MPALSSEIASLIQKSPTSIHAATTVADELEMIGFEPLDPNAKLCPDGPYYYQEGGTLIAWIQNQAASQIRVVGAHSDSPGFRIRPKPERFAAGLTTLAVELYGSPLWNSWLDRDLGIAGQVIVQGASAPELRKINIDKPVCKIPQLAVHLDRSVNANGLKLDPSKDLAPVLLGSSDFTELLTAYCDVEPDRILAWDLGLYDLAPPEIFGDPETGFLSSARIDNLVSTFAGLLALRSLDSTAADFVPMLCVFDHEEVGSGSNKGAAGALLKNILYSSLSNIATARPGNGSLALSVDCAHATHPSHLGAHEPNHEIAMNKGIALKSNANQRYATSIEGERQLLEILGGEITLQPYSHPNHLPCGSTIGPVLAQSLGIETVDIGVPQLAMHSVRETCGNKDLADLVALLKLFWSA